MVIVIGGIELRARTIIATNRALRACLATDVKVGSFCAIATSSSATLARVASDIALSDASSGPALSAFNFTVAEHDASEILAEIAGAGICASEGTAATAVQEAGTVAGSIGGKAESAAAIGRNENNEISITVERPRMCIDARSTARAYIATYESMTGQSTSHHANGGALFSFT